MILSRLAATATRSYRSLSLAYNLARIRGSATDPTGRPRDPEVCAGREYETQHAVPAGKPEEMAGKYGPEAAKRRMEEEYRLGKETEPLAPPKPPHAPITRLENAGVHNPAEPIVQQRRKNSTLTVLEEISCAGLDGTPWPEDERSRREQVEDENEYSSHRKASPLSEIQVADTRKPITRAADGTACEEMYNEPGDVIGWLPEQLDTAEQALERARRIWMENAMRGDPDSPHGRVLRELRGEWF